MSVEQSGHQPWLYEPGTTDPLTEPEFDAFGERTLITPPVEPAVAAPGYRAPGRHHTPAWAHAPHTEVLAFTAPLDTLEPAFGEPMYAQIFAERNPEAVASQVAKPRYEPAAPGIQVMSLQDRGPLVKEGEQGSIFDAMNRERATEEVKDYYAELRRPYLPSYKDVLAAASEPAAPAQETPRQIAAITPVKAIEPATPRTLITVKGEQEGDVAAVIEEEQSGLDKEEAAAFLTRVLRGLEKSRDADLAAEAAEAAKIAKEEAETQAYAEKAARETQAKLEAQAEADRIAAEEQLARDTAIIEAAAPKTTEAKIEAAQVHEQPPVVVHEEHLSLRGIRAAAKELVGNHKKAARIAEYAGVAVVAVAAGARLLGRFRRR